MIPPLAARGRPGKRKGRRPVATETTLTEDAYRLIKWRITTVQLAPGATFTETQLAAELELSRTPLREALLLLRREGLVIVEGRSGYRVSPVTLRDVHDLASVRRSLEGEAAFAAASRLVEPGQLETLEERVPSVSGSDPAASSAWIESDRRLHLALAIAAGNQHLVSAIDPVLEKSARLLHLLVMLHPGTAAVSHDHADLLAALHARDGERARTVTVRDISAMEATVSRALMASPGLLSASLVVETPRNQFYLDVPASEAGSAEPTASTRPDRARSRKLSVEPMGVKR